MGAYTNEFVNKLKKAHAVMFTEPVTYPGGEGVVIMVKFNSFTNLYDFEEDLNKSYQNMYDEAYSGLKGCTSKIEAVYYLENIKRQIEDLNHVVYTRKYKNQLNYYHRYITSSERNSSGELDEWKDVLTENSEDYIKIAFNIIQRCKKYLK